jgi:hypothetical protein
LITAIVPFKQQGYLMQQWEWWTRWKKKTRKMSQVGVFRRPSFLTKGLRLPKKLDLPKTRLAKKNVVMLGTMIFFSPMLQVIH